MGKHIKKTKTIDRKIKAKQQVIALFKEIKEDQKKHPIRHWFSRKLFQLQNLPSDIRLVVVGFFQRGKRGWANSDTWDFDDYLADIIIGGMTHLRKYNHGHPVVKDIKSSRQWKSILTKIINGFKAYKQMCNWVICRKKNTYKKLNKKFNEGMKLFVRYYGAFWD